MTRVKVFYEEKLKEAEQMDDIELCQWVIDKREELDTFIEQAKAKAGPNREEVFKKLLAVNNSLVALFHEVMIAREKEGLVPLAHPG